MKRISLFIASVLLLASCCQVVSTQVNVIPQPAEVEIYNGEIGTLHGCRFIENPDAAVCGGDYVNKAGTVSYANFFFGKDAFGIIDPEGGALEMIVKDKTQVGGPLNQFSTIGFKFETNGATILYPERILNVWSTSTYSGIDQPNYDEALYGTDSFDKDNNPYNPGV